MKPLIRKIIRKRFIQEQFSNGKVTPSYCRLKTIVHYNDRGEVYFQYQYCRNGKVYKQNSETASLPIQEADCRTYDVVEQKKDEFGQVVYEKWIFHPAIGWESNYILYVVDLPMDEIVVFGEKDFFFQYGETHRQTHTESKAVFLYFRCDEQGQPVSPDHPEAILTITEKYQYNENGAPIFERHVLDCSNAPKYREEAEREFLYDVFGNNVKTKETITDYDHMGKIDYIRRKRTYSKIIYRQ